MPNVVFFKNKTIKKKKKNLKKGNEKIEKLISFFLF